MDALGARLGRPAVTPSYWREQLQAVGPFHLEKLSVKGVAELGEMLGSAYFERKRTGEVEAYSMLEALAQYAEACRKPPKV